MQLAGTTVAITGVGGFIGARLAERARTRGARVRGLEQSAAAAGRPELSGVDVVVGDVTDPEAVRSACTGADVVLHTAAVVREHGPRALFDRVNVGGTRVVADACAVAGVRRLVHLSSVMVYGFHYSKLVAEEGPLEGEGNPYCETKIESERVALSAHDPGDLEVTVIRPGDVYGPGSVPWVLRPYDLLRKGLFVLPSAGRGIINHVYVDNLVDAIVATIERDASGIYNVTDGVETTCMEYFTPIARLAGRTRISTVPAPVLKPVFACLEASARVLGREPLAARSSVDYLMRPHAYSVEKARRELDYVPAVGLPEGMQRVAQSLA